MIWYYLSSNSEMCYSNFLPHFLQTKRGLKIHGSGQSGRRVVIGAPELENWSLPAATGSSKQIRPIRWLNNRTASFWKICPSNTSPCRSRRSSNASAEADATRGPPPSDLCVTRGCLDHGKNFVPVASNVLTLIRSIKCNLIKKPIAQMEANSRYESIKPNYSMIWKYDATVTIVKSWCN